MKARTLAAVLLIACAGAVSAAGDGSYRVDSAGGPLTLGEHLAAAFGAWADAGALGVPVETPDGDTLFSWGDPDLFGPDMYSLTLQRSGDAPALQVLLNELAGERLDAVLLHEAGLVLGLPPAPAGAMKPALGSTAAAAPSEEDVEQLLSRLSALEGDLNADGRVDFLDLLELAARFGSRGLNLPGDLDGDGEVTATDLRILRENYEFSEPREPEAPELIEQDLPAETDGEPEAGDGPAPEEKGHAGPESGEELPGDSAD